MADEPTKLAVAKMMGISERHLHRMLRNKTASRERAEELARYLGRTPEDYLRAARPKNRRQEARNYPFIDFVSSFGDELAEDIGILSQLSEAFVGAFEEFNRRYRYQRTPRDFESFEHFFGFMAQAAFSPEYLQEALCIWQRFKVWRVKQECAERIFDIEMGDDVS